MPGKAKGETGWLVTNGTFITRERKNLKILTLIFVTLISLVNIYSQSKDIVTGLYLVVSEEPCNKQNVNNTIVFSSDTLCLEQNPVITVNDIESYIAENSLLDGDEMYVLNIKLNEAASLKFEEITGENVGQKMAMVINKKVIMAAVIRDPVTSGRLTISGEDKQEIDEWVKELEKEISGK